MLNKRNSKVLKALSAAIVGSIALGNCSTVQMMEKSKPDVMDNKIAPKTMKKSEPNAIDTLCKSDEVKARVRGILSLIFKDKSSLFNDAIELENDAIIVENIIKKIRKAEKDDARIASDIIDLILEKRLTVARLTRCYLLNKNGNIDKSRGLALDEYLSKHPMKSISKDKQALRLYRDELQLLHNFTLYPQTTRIMVTNRLDDVEKALQRLN